MMMDGDGDAQLRVATCVAQHQHRIMHATAPFQFIMQRQQLSLHRSRPVARLRPADSDDGRMGSVGQESAGIVGSAQPPASNFVFFFWCSGYFSIFSGFSFAIGEVCPGPPIPPTGSA